MHEKLFSDRTQLDVRKIVEKVIAVLEKDKNSLIENDDINKIFMLSILFFEKKEFLDKFIEIVIYIDDSLMPIKHKSLMIVALANMITNREKTNDLLSFDINSLYLLVDFFRTRTMQQIKDEYKILNNEAFLHKIRRASLDVDTRIDLIAHFVELVETKGVAFDNATKIKRLQEEYMEELRNNSANEILGRANYIRGDYFRGVDLR